MKRLSVGPKTLYERAVSMLVRGETEKARKLLESLARDFRADDGYWVNLSLARTVSGDANGGFEAAQKALSINPQNLTAHQNLLFSCLKSGSLELSGLQHFREHQSTLSLHEGCARNAVDLMRAQKAFDEAIDLQSRIFRATKDLIDLRSFIGLCIWGNKPAKTYSALLAHFRGSLDAMLIKKLARLIHFRSRFRDVRHKEAAETYYRNWALTEGEIDQLRSLEGASKDLLLKSVTLFYACHFSNVPVNLLRAYNDMVRRVLPAQPFRPSSSSARRTKVGVLSEQYGLHVVDWALDLVNLLPKEDFEVCICIVDKKGDWGAALKKAPFKPIHLEFDHVPVLDTVSQVRSADIDLLLYPDVGMTASSRVLSAYRLARYQACLWGHPMTTGSLEMDFFYSSRSMEPIGAKKTYTERLIRAPNTGILIKQPTEYLMTAKDPNLETTLISLQTISKYGVEADHLYARLLSEIDGLELHFVESDDPSLTAQFKRRLKRVCKSANVNYDRISFIPRLPRRQHLERLSKYRVNLDGLSWSGGNSTLDAIEGDVLTVTLAGGDLKARHTAGINSILGLDELVSRDAEGLINTVRRLMLDKPYFAALSKRQTDRKKSLFENRAVIRGIRRLSCLLRRSSLSKPSQS